MGRETTVHVEAAIHPSSGLWSFYRVLEGLQGSINVLGMSLELLRVQGF